MTQKSINQDLLQYIEAKILPRYDAFDKAHQQDHARMVIRQSMDLAERMDVDINMVYAIAAYHVTKPLPESYKQIRTCVAGSQRNRLP